MHLSPQLPSTERSGSTLEFLMPISSSRLPVVSASRLQQLRKEETHTGPGPSHLLQLRIQGLRQPSKLAASLWVPSEVRHMTLLMLIVHSRIAHQCQVLMATRNAPSKVDRVFLCTFVARIICPPTRGTRIVTQTCASLM